jgi:hypothetical protein
LVPPEDKSPPADVEADEESARALVQFAQFQLAREVSAREKVARGAGLA